MKKIKHIITFLVILFSIKNYSQEIIKPIEDALHDHFSNNPGTYYKDTNGKLLNCVGTWIYDNGSDYFKTTISMSKVLDNVKYNVHSDCLLIKYEYRKNGITKYYNLNTFNVPAGANTKPSELQSAFVKGNEISVVYYEPSFTDCYRRKIGDLNIQYVYEVGMPQPQLIWTRTTDEHYFRNEPCDNGIPTDNSDFLIPANMVLTKVN